jgi:hypothetical protein
MNSHQFDSLVKALRQTGTRRGFFRTVSSAFGAVIVAGRADRSVHAQFGNCPPGLQECSGVCVDTSSDPAHCGSCFRACPMGQTCGFMGCSCPSGMQECSGACVDTSSDPANCGSCGHACASGQICGFMGCSCPSGTSECSGICTNTSSDPAHCGSCFNACRGGESCRGGTCVSTNQVPAIPTLDPGSDPGPPPDSGPPGVSFVTLASGSIEVLSPGTANLVLGHIRLAPGATLPFDPTDPSVDLVYTASGALAFRVEAPMTVARRVEPGMPVPSEPEAVAANTEFTMVDGDSALFPPNATGEVRNDGDEEATAWVVNVALFTTAANTTTP